jgi:hypothetical protein
MKKLKISIFLLCVWAFIAFIPSFLPEWSTGVRHSNLTPSVSPDYSVRSSLLQYDSTTQSFFVNNKSFGWWLLMSPDERYVRGAVNVYFNDNQDLYFSDIETKIRTQAQAGRVLNGLYIVKFTSTTGEKGILATLSNVPILPPTHIVTDNDYIVFRYYRNKLVGQEKFDDKSQSYFQLLENRILVLETKIISPPVNPSDENIIIANSPIHAGQLGVKIGEKFEASFKNVMGVPAGTILKRRF